MYQNNNTYNEQHHHDTSIMQNTLPL